MKKYYADIYHAKTDTLITIGEYSEEAIHKSIRACIRQREFKTADCICMIRIEDM